MSKKLLYFSVFIILLSSCGSSVITINAADTSRPYAVYIDKQYKGLSTSKIKIQRSGLPQHKLIEIKDGRGKVVGREKISRDVNIAKLLAGFFYLYPLWFFSWEYDKKIEIFVDKPAQNSGSAWDADNAKSAWD